jgi:hypothetical protein
MPLILAEAYPEPSMFGVTPAWGLWVRHAERVTLHNVRLETETPDERPEVVTEAADLEHNEERMTL